MAKDRVQRERSVPNTVQFRQLNKDAAYFSEKKWAGQSRGGHTAGVLIYFNDKGEVESCLLIDAGLQTIVTIDQLLPEFWDWPVAVLITHGHPDHHIELAFLSELWCKRRNGRRPPLEVYCTPTTMDFLRKIHGFNFGSGNTLQPAQHEIVPGASVRHGVFDIHAIDASSHFAGAVNYVVEFFNRHKIIIGWDMKDVPTITSVLENPSLALIEANTLTRQPQTGHVSLDELLTSGFLRGLQATVDPVAERYGVWFVHYSGREDLNGLLDDRTLEILAKQICLQGGIGGIGGVARRGQAWQFRCC